MSLDLAKNYLKNAKGCSHWHPREATTPLDLWSNDSWSKDVADVGKPVAICCA